MISLGIIYIDLIEIIYKAKESSKFENRIVEAYSIILFNPDINLGPNSYQRNKRRLLADTRLWFNQNLWHIFQPTTICKQWLDEIFRLMNNLSWLWDFFKPNFGLLKYCTYKTKFWKGPFWKRKKKKNCEWHYFAQFRPNITTILASFAPFWIHPTQEVFGNWKKKSLQPEK